MLLRLACPPTDWVRLASALDALVSLTLAGVVRTLLAAAPRSAGTEPVALAFTPQQAGALQRVATALGLDLPAAPIAEGPDSAGWVTAPAERAAAVAAAETILRAHRRQRAA